MEGIVESAAVAFIRIAGYYIHGFEEHIAAKTLYCRFVAHFGVSPCHCAYIWLLTSDEMFNIKAEKIHLLWTLNLLKTDDTEHCMKGRWGCDEKTFRKWLYLVLDAICDLDLVRIMLCRQTHDSIF